MLVILLVASVALGQGRGGRGRNRGGDRASASRHVDSRTVAFLRRIDTNHNGMIDAEEVAGSYKSMIEEVLTRAGIELKYPISLDKIAPTSKADRSRNSGDDAEDESSSSENKSSSGDSGGAQSANGFGKPKPSQPAVPGFGQASASTGGDTKTAATPKSHAASTASTPSTPAKHGDAASGSAVANSDPPDSAKRSGPKSGRFLTPKERLAKGLPEWFLEKDRDGDGQVSMAEFADEWTADVAAEFNRYDLNHDGIVTAAECLKATESPHRKSK
jgi:Ca2+-binding EF-hand superfamily protein